MTYWNDAGNYQEQLDKLSEKIPTQGKADEAHIDIIRNISNCYYDHYNNGNCNWGNRRDQFAHIEYYANELVETAKAEGVDNIHELLVDIRTPLDDDYEDEFYCGVTDSHLERNWEKLADIVIAWAWDVEQGKENQS